MLPTEKPSAQQPGWVCRKCGDIYRAGAWKVVNTWHGGKCGVCQQQATVTEPRNCGYLLPSWMEHK